MTTDGFSWPAVLGHLIDGRDLDEAEAADALRSVMAGQASPAQSAGFLVALRAKGETSEEIAGLVRAMLDHAQTVDLTTVSGPEGTLVDTCGTGGDQTGTFNISTVAALVVAACGVPVAKHGNRSASSRCGSADLLEAWGVAIDLPPTAVAATIDEVGIGFLFARTFHPAMRHVAEVRSGLGVPTVFNVLGPLTNPAGVDRQVVGVADEELAPLVAGALLRLGRRHALVFRGQDGLDELSTTGPSRLWEIRDGRIQESLFDPSSLGIERAELEDLQGGDVADNVAIADAVLAGRRGPAADIVALNAGAALYVGGAADDVAAGVDRAYQVLDAGTAGELRDRWVTRSQELSSGVS